MPDSRDWKLPEPDQWLVHDEKQNTTAYDESIKSKLENLLEYFGVPSRITSVATGAAFTRFEIELEPGVRVSSIVSLESDIAQTMAPDSRPIRIEAPIPGKSAIGIEIPNSETAIVPIRKGFLSQEFQSKSHPLSFVLGEDVAGRSVVANISQMPHLLLAGSEDSGKSVCISGIISSIIARQSPDDVRFILVENNNGELAHYEGIPHLLTSVVHESSVAANALMWVCGEMDHRYRLFAEKGVRNIDSYNQLMDDPADRMYRIVIVIDEYADLMNYSSPNVNVELYICRITQLARATGIHMILASRHTIPKIITGAIKSNIPSRISFAVNTQTDSRIILDMKGAEALIGRGDMLYMSFDSNKLVRLQCTFVSDIEVKRLVDFWKSQQPSTYVDFKPHVDKEDSKDFISGDTSEYFYMELLFVEAALYVVSTNEVSISKLQRDLHIGFPRAAKIVDMLEERGIVGPYDSAQSRRILVPLIHLYQHLSKSFTNQVCNGISSIDPRVGEKDDNTETLYKQAVDAVISSGQASISMLQRKLRIGYNRAVRLVELMEERGIVGPYDGTGPRKILLPPPEG